MSLIHCYKQIRKLEEREVVADLSCPSLTCVEMDS